MVRKPVVPPRRTGTGSARPSTPSAGKAGAAAGKAEKAAKPAKAAKLASVKPARPAAGPAAKPEAKASRKPREGRQQRVSRRAALRQQLGEVRRFTKGSRLKRGITLSAIGSVVALVLLVLATIYTPMMSIDQIQILGVHRMKLSTVQNAVKSLVGTPLTTVDEGKIQQRLEGFPLIESFTTVSLPPHTLQIYIRERQPIGIVTVGATDYLYDPAGVQIGPTTNHSKYPTILVTGNPAHSPNFREAVSVLLALPAELYPKITSIQATSVDDVRIYLRGQTNTQILWGDASQSLLKSKVLTALLATVKKRQSVVFDVSSPNAPTVRFGGF